MHEINFNLFIFDQIYNEFLKILKSMINNTNNCK